MEDKITTVVMPICSIPEISSFRLGKAAGVRNIPIEVQAESDITQVGENKYELASAVVCSNDKLFFKVSVGIRTIMYASGKMDDIMQVVKKEIRNNVFKQAEDMILKVPTLHGCPLHIQLVKYIIEKERMEGEN